jgi:parallel beta-helix repeat protein
MFLFLSLMTVSLASQLSGVKAETGIIRVPNDFATIQEAINAAANGSTILVNNGVYRESPVVNKSLTLLGADKQGTIIEGARPETAIFGFGAGITVTADNSMVNGFTVRNWTYGIWLNPSRGTTVNGNIITSNVYGISLDRSFNNTVSNNIVSLSIGGYPDFQGGYGFHLFGSANNTINDNIITRSTNGFDLEPLTESGPGSDYNMIYRNLIEDNVVGIHLYRSDNTQSSTIPSFIMRITLLIKTTTFGVLVGEATIGTIIQVWMMVVAAELLMMAWATLVCRGTERMTSR